MASLVRIAPRGERGKVSWRVQLWDRTRDTRTPIYIGAMPRKAAERFLMNVDALESARDTGTLPDAEVTRWLAALEPNYRAKLAEERLCTPDPGATAEAGATIRLRPFAARYLFQRRRELKPATKEILRLVVRRLVAHFDNPPLDTITRDGASDWAAVQRARGISDATLRGYIRYAKGLFGPGEHGAVGRELITRSPFAHLTSAAIAADRSHYITPADTAKLIDVAPSAQWKALIGLARYAGLRCPSETHTVRWVDVDWDQRRVKVFAPKTSRTRTVPITSELHPLLLNAFNAAPDGAERVITLTTHKSNLRRSAGILIDRAKMAPWPDTWQAMRRSRETEWLERFPAHVCAAWLGHGVQVQLRHYAQVRETDFDRATESAHQPAHQKPAEPSGNEMKTPTAETVAQLAVYYESLQKTPESQRISVIEGMGRPGLEPGTPAFSMRCQSEIQDHKARIIQHLETPSIGREGTAHQPAHQKPENAPMVAWLDACPFPLSAATRAAVLAAMLRGGPS